MIEVFVSLVPTRALAPSQVGEADKRAARAFLFEFEDDHGTLAADIRDRGRRAPGEGEASQGLKPKNAHALTAPLARFSFGREVDLVGPIHAQIDFAVRRIECLDPLRCRPGLPHLFDRSVHFELRGQHTVACAGGERQHWGEQQQKHSNSHQSS